MRFQMIFLYLHLKHTHRHTHTPPQLSPILWVFDNSVPAARKGRSVWRPFFLLIRFNFPSLHLARNLSSDVLSIFCVLSCCFFFFFARGVRKEGIKERPKSLSASARLQPIKVAFSPESRTAVAISALFSFDPGSALGSVLDDQWFCCKRWFMNNNVLKWVKIIIFLALCQSPHLEQTRYWQSSNNSNPLMKGIINSSMMVAASFHFHSLKMPKFGIN